MGVRAVGVCGECGGVLVEATAWVGKNEPYCERCVMGNVIDLRGLDASTLEDLLSMRVKSKDLNGNDILVSPEFRVAVQKFDDNGVHVIIHACGHNSETLDLCITDNDVVVKR